MCAELVTVLFDADDGHHEATANLEDISPSGACVQLETAAKEGTDIEVVCASCRLKGKVRYCRFVGIGYDTGIAFDEPRSWNRKLYTPTHLLDVGPIST
jgi:hypothetical protein